MVVFYDDGDESMGSILTGNILLSRVTINCGGNNLQHRLSYLLSYLFS